MFEISISKSLLLVSADVCSWYSAAMECFAKTHRINIFDIKIIHKPYSNQNWESIII